MSEYSYPTTYSYGGNTSTGSSSRPATLTYPDGSVRESSVPQSLINIEGRPAWADATEEQKALVVKLIRRFLELVYYDARAITDRTALTHWRIWLQVGMNTDPQGWVVGFSMNGGEPKTFLLYQAPDICFSIMDDIMREDPGWHAACGFGWRDERAVYNLDCQSDQWVILAPTIYDGQQWNQWVYLKHIAVENHASKHFLVVEFQTHNTPQS